jgi:ComF family protein
MSLIHDITDIFFPRVCSGCGNVLAHGEKLICTDCLVKLPRTGFWKEENNSVAQMFWGRIPVQNASSFLFFQKGSRLQNIMHKFKYRNQKEIGYELGKLFGSNLLGTNYTSVDIIIPVPLHISKYRKRGYNQSEWIAKGLSEVLKIPFENNAIERVKATDSQTRKAQYERWENVENIFNLISPTTFENKHVMIVDDILTTGATVEACANAVLNVPGIKISLATVAVSII